jgi:coiled-coil domain-containing protein 12
MTTKEEDVVGHLDEEARKRKERLQNLKRKANSNVTTVTEVLPTPTFRSYNPTDNNLKELKLPKAMPESVEDKIEMDVDANLPELVTEIDLTNLAPRKVDWDLKRNIQKKLDKLEKRTQRSIAELIRERIKESIQEDSKSTEN